MRKTAQIMFIFLIIMGLSFSASANAQSVPANADLTPEILPLTFDDNGMAYVQVKVGERVLRMCLDTGADKVTVAIKPSVLREITVNYSSSVTKNMDSSGEIYRSRTFTIPSVKIGNLSFRNLVASEELRKTPGDDDGIIGNGLLESFHVLIDYSHSRLILYPKSKYPVELDLSNWMKLPFEEGIVVKGKLEKDATELRFCLDTAAVCINEGKTYGLLKPQFATQMVQAANVEMPTALTNHFYLGGTDIGPMEFFLYDFAGAPVDGFLGHNFLVSHPVFIDFDKCLLYVR